MFGSALSVAKGPVRTVFFGYSDGLSTFLSTAADILGSRERTWDKVI